MNTATLVVPRSEDACARLQSLDSNLDLLTAQLNSRLDQEAAKKWEKFEDFADHWNLPLAVPVREFARLDQNIAQLRTLIEAQPNCAQPLASTYSTELKQLGASRKELLEAATAKYCGARSNPEERAQLVREHWDLLRETYKHVITVDCLRWRDEQGYPSFAVHSAHSKETTQFCAKLVFPSAQKQCLQRSFMFSAPNQQFEVYEDLRLKLQDECLNIATNFKGSEPLLSVELGIQTSLKDVVPLKTCRVLSNVQAHFAQEKTIIVAEPRDGTWERSVAIQQRAPEVKPVAPPISKFCPILFGVGPLNTLWWIDSWKVSEKEESLVTNS